MIARGSQPWIFDRRAIPEGRCARPLIETRFALLWNTRMANGYEPIGAAPQ
jgi:hypothetical protein